MATRAYEIRRGRLARRGGLSPPSSPRAANHTAEVHDTEPFWPAQLAAAAALLYVTLPHALIMGPRWLVPGVEGILLIGLIVTTLDGTTTHVLPPPRRHHRAGLPGQSHDLISLFLLARFLLDGSHARGHALLFAGAVGG